MSDINNEMEIETDGLGVMGFLEETSDGVVGELSSLLSPGKYVFEILEAVAAPREIRINKDSDETRPAAAVNFRMTIKEVVAVPGIDTESLVGRVFNHSVSQGPKMSMDEFKKRLVGFCEAVVGDKPTGTFAEVLADMQAQQFQGTLKRTERGGNVYVNLVTNSKKDIKPL